MIKKQRGFEEVPAQFIKVEETTILPVRGDSKSAGYDLYLKKTLKSEPNEYPIFWPDLFAYMQDDEVLSIHVRSSIGVKKGLMLKNVTGIIDSSYYANPGNYGNIGICLYNNSNEPQTIECHDRIAQGIFQKYLIVDEDNALHEVRFGGFGSSGK